MIIYEYAPVNKKKREKVTLLLCLGLSVTAFALAQVPRMLFPVLLKLLGIAMLFASVMLLTRYLMRRYIYCVEEREGSQDGAPYDFVITEYYGNHKSVVCRISVDEILGAKHINRQTEKDFSSKRRGKRVYSYIDLLAPENGYILDVCHDDEQFFVRVLADKPLLALLLRTEKQYLS